MPLADIRLIEITVRFAYYNVFLVLPRLPAGIWTSDGARLAYHYCSNRGWTNFEITQP